jgi:S1-C subfamily serine protease
MFRIPPAAILMILCAGAYASLRAQEPPAGIDAAAAVEKMLVEVIARNEPSVVAIARVRHERANEAFPPEIRPDAFGRQPLPILPAQPTDPNFIPNEFGTGVVIDRHGLILTAYQVLGEDSDYYVTAADRKVYQATVKAADPRSDLAVLAIEAADLTPIALGTADALKKGQIVVNLGNPYAIARDGQASAAWGIVSNLHRKAPATPSEADPTGRPTLHHFGTLIQTDARLNLGANGGPLLDLRGEMVGLCVAFAAAPGYEAAGGYAIAVDATFRRAVETLKQGREVEYGYLGVQPTNLRPQEVVAGLKGTRIGQVVAGTPAARCGLRTGDIVTAIDGEPIFEADALVLAIGRLPPESAPRLNVLRDGRPLSINAKLCKYPVRGKKIVTSTDPAWRGLRVEYPTAIADETGQPRGAMSPVDDGVIVTEVLEGSPAWTAGLRRDMLITHVGRQPIRTPKEFATAVAGRTATVSIRLADDPAGMMRSVSPP